MVLQHSAFPVPALQIPALAIPGQADGEVTINLGYGRQGSEVLARGVGSNAYWLRRSDAPWFDSGLEVRRIGEASGIERVATTQTEWIQQGRPIAPVWQAWAARTGSADLAFVAAAWRLSERTGAPLAEAVQRAVVSVRESRERMRRVNVAVAGPRATVVVLTALPLTGPVFGLACGVPPTELYLSNTIGAASAVAGVVLIWAGRLWCRRLVDSAMHGSRARTEVGRRS